MRYSLRKRTGLQGRVKLSSLYGNLKKRAKTLKLKTSLQSTEIISCFLSECYIVILHI